MKRAGNFYIFFLIGLFFLGACENRETGERMLPVKNKVQSEREAKGEELFNKHCITCHTLRYIEIQPAFPRKTWVKITDKMIKSFGAPIPDSSAVLIVDYLMSVKGKNE